MAQELMLEPQSLSAIMEQADRAGFLMSEVRGAILAPEARNQAPSFNATQLAALCEVDRSQVVYRLSKGDLPPGTINESGNRREFSLEEAHAWIREYRAKRLRPTGAEAVCISVANFKCGLGKTTTAMSLAQGLTLKGHRVLVIDCDPQGSLTTLFGIMPDTEVDESQTILPVCLGQQDRIEPQGRRALGIARAKQSGFGRYPTGRDPVQYVLKRLVFVFEHASRGTVAATRAERAAARVAAASLATPLAKVDDITRLRGLETAARVAGDEPEVILRLAAVRFSCMRDVASMDASLRADRMLRNAAMHPGIDNLAFLMSELEHGTDEPLTLGRVAAGITLLTAGKSLQELAYLRDEVLDDMRFSRWLSGREQDQALLAEIFKNLERSRRCEKLALPQGEQWAATTDPSSASRSAYIVE